MVRGGQQSGASNGFSLMQVCPIKPLWSLRENSAIKPQNVGKATCVVRGPRVVRGDAMVMTHVTCAEMMVGQERVSAIALLGREVELLNKVDESNAVSTVNHLLEVCHPNESDGLSACNRNRYSVSLM